MKTSSSVQKSCAPPVGGECPDILDGEIARDLVDPPAAGHVR
jgi:hypothetical protein